MHDPTNKRKATPRRAEPEFAKVRVLVIGTRSLFRIVTHLFAAEPAFEVVGSLRSTRNLAPQAERLLPRLIVAGVKPVGTGVGAAVSAIKRASPASRLILLCHERRFMSGARRFGADACLDPEKLIAQLLPTASALSADSGPASRSNAS
jgi:hypothetical protein